MTKKSLNRMERDEQKKKADLAESQSRDLWRDLDDMYKKCSLGLASQSALGIVLNRKELIAQIADGATFLINVRTLRRDIESMALELNQIYDQHKEYGRRDTTMEEVFSTVPFQILELYSAFALKAESVLTPTVNHILEQTNAAELRLKALTQIVEDVEAGIDPVKRFTEPAEEAKPETESAQDVPAAENKE
jgi:methionyl-tRNA synthetase